MKTLKLKERGFFIKLVRCNNFFFYFCRLDYTHSVQSDCVEGYIVLAFQFDCPSVC